MKISPGPFLLISMSSIFGLVSKEAIVEETEAKRLIEYFKYRGSDNFSYLTKDEIKTVNFSDLNGLSTYGNIFIGSTFFKTEKKPFKKFDEGYFGLCGSIYEDGKTIDPTTFAGNANEILLSPEGEFYSVYSSNSTLSLARDRLGTKPIFYGENEKYFMFAPERYVFQKFNISEKPLPPDTILSYANKKFNLEKAKQINQEKTPSENKLKDSLINSVKARLSAKKIGIMFSGGLDSSIMATLANKFSKDVELITIGTETAQDLEYAEKVANELGIVNFSITVLDIDDIREALHEVGDYISREIHYLALAVPLHICCKLARQKGLSTIWNGQGAEELFAGYARYHRFLLEKKDVASITFNDLKELYQKDLERNDLVAARNSINGSYPFLDYDVVKNALAFPISMKISASDERKIILRKVAKELGVPKLAYERPKKAVQYSTGIHKLVEKIIKSDKNAA